MTTVAARRAIEIRDARPEDNAELVGLTAACVMEGSIAMRVDRAPDFFALNRLEGDAWRVGVALGSDERIIGCVAAAGRDAYVNGAVRRVSYASDLKVHPTARGSGAADLLSEYARDAARDFGGETAPCVLTILSGNRAMQHRARGPRGTVVLSRFASLGVAAIPLLWERREHIPGLTVRRAQASDVEEMAAVWSRLAPARQLAGALDAETMTRWIAAAPGLAITDYLIATDPSGRMSGFLGVWDQSSFKQLRVVRYSRRMGVARHAINAAAAMVQLRHSERSAGCLSFRAERGIALLPTEGPLYRDDCDSSTPALRAYARNDTSLLRRFARNDSLSGRLLPPPGEPLPVLATVHICAESPHVLRALLLDAYRRWRGRGYACLTVGLDVTDPLAAATRGLLGQTTMVDAYVSSGAGVADPRMFDGRPLHFETALV